MISIDDKYIACLYQCILLIYISLCCLFISAAYFPELNNPFFLMEGGASGGGGIGPLAEGSNCEGVWDSGENCGGLAGAGGSG